MVPDWQPQTPLPKQIGFAPLHAVVDCQSEFVQRSRAALPELDRFTQLDPQNPGNKEYDRALALVNSGRPIC